MKLKLNTNALKEMLIYRDNIYEAPMAGYTSQYMLGINSGIDAGGGSHTSTFLENLMGMGYAPSASKGLYLYKGAMPTNAEIDTYIAAAPLTVPDTGLFRNADRLLSVTPSTQSLAQGSILHSFSPKAASASGIATWFLFGVYAISTYAARPSYFVVGSITEIGGGGDIELPDVNIVSGTTYRIPSYELKLPSKFSS